MTPALESVADRKQMDCQDGEMTYFNPQESFSVPGTPTRIILLGEQNKTEMVSSKTWPLIGNMDTEYQSQEGH